MIRKLISAIAIFALATIGLSQASPASAAGTFSPAVASSMDPNTLIVVPGTDQFAIMFYTTNESNVGYLKSAHLNLDGSVTDVTVIASGANSSFWLTQDSVVGDLNSNGILATWVRNTYTQGFGMNPGSTEHGVYSAFTDDGVEWSVPVQAFDSFSYSNNDDICGFVNMGFCGYGNLKIAQDSNGVLVMAITRHYGTSVITKIKTSIDGTNWGTESDLSTVANNVYLQELTALVEGGFIAFFSGTVNGTSSVYYSRSLSVRPGFWTAPKVVVGGNVDSLTFTPTGTGKYSLLYFGNTNDTTNLYRKVFDTKTKTWSSQETLNTAPTWLATGTDLVASRGNRVSYIYGVSIAAAQQTKIFLVDIIDGVAKPAVQVADVGDQQPNVFGLRVNGDGTVSFAYSGQWQSPQLVSVSPLGVPTVTPIPVDMAAGNSIGTVSPSGNMFLEIKHWQTNTAKTIAYQGAEAPVPTGLMKMNGKAKVAATLSATVPTFSSRSGIGTTSIQWYSCRTKVATVQTTVPAGCVAIAKAKATKFKVTTKQKSKYLAVAVTNTNAVGTTTLFSPSTAKTK